MKSLLFISALLLFSVPTFAAKKVALDVECDKMAANARAFATLKTTGVATTETEFQAFVSEPTVNTYPIKSIIKYVYESEGKTPFQIYEALYGRCVLMGYNELYSYFRDRELADQLKAALSAANEHIKNLQAENDELKKEVADLSKQLGPRRRVAVK